LLFRKNLSGGDVMVDRRKSPPLDLDIDRRKKDRRVHIKGRGVFKSYEALYTMMFESPRITPDIEKLMEEIMPDGEWQVRFTQEVSTDRLFGRPKTKEELRHFFIKLGMLEVFVEAKTKVLERKV
jgi:hypothetical protein